MIIPMIPLKMIECWMLADEGSHKKLFGLKNPGLAENPELIWGEIKDPSGNYPQRFIRRVLEKVKGGKAVCDRNTYFGIAEATFAEVLCERCNIIFPKFCDDFVFFGYGA